MTVGTFERTGRRFELEVDGQLAIIDYILNKDNIMFLTHTEVPLNRQGEGIGSLIVQKTLEYIDENGFTLAPMCPFVAAYLRRHPKRQSLLAEGYHV